MGEQTGSRLNHRSAVCKFPSEKIRKKPLRRHRSIIMAVSLGFILTTTGLVYYLMLPPPPLYIPPEPLVTTPHAPIEIEGDANFSATALLEGWSGDGSPENPYIIDGLGIDLGGRSTNCIVIKETYASFIISNCNLTGAYPCYLGSIYEAGIYLENVMNGVLVNNIVNNNSDGIILIGSDFNTVANNTCNNNDRGIRFFRSDFNTVANNTCSSNGNNGIYLFDSHSNTVSDNTCNNNRIGIYLTDSHYNTVINNICFGNTELDILQEPHPREDVPEVRDMTEFLLWLGSLYIIGFSVITLLGGIWIVNKRVSKEGN